MNLIVFYSVFFFGVFLVFINFILITTLKNKSKNEKILFWYLFVSLLETLLCYSIYRLFPNSNYFVSHLYFFIHFTFLSYIYHQIIDNSNIKKGIKITYPIVYLIVFLSFLLNPSLFFGFNLIEIILICLAIILFAFILIFQTIETEKRYFYFSIGIILYFSISCLIFISGSLDKVLVFSRDPYIDHWIIKDLFYILFQLFIFKEYIFIKQNQHELSK